MPPAPAPRPRAACPATPIAARRDPAAQREGRPGETLRVVQRARPSRRRPSRASSRASSNPPPAACCRCSAPTSSRGDAGARSPLDNVPVSADYVVGPGDELVIRAWGCDRRGLPRRRRPQRPDQPAEGRQLQRRRRARCRHRTPPARADRPRVHQLQPQRHARPAARREGVRRRPGAAARASTRFRSQSTMLSAVAAAGGPGPNGSMRKISLRRDGRVISELDVYEFLVQGDKSTRRAARRRRRGRVPARRARGWP